MKATGTSEQPEEHQAASNHFENAADPSFDISGTVPPLGGTPTGKAKSFIVPNIMNMNAETIRNTLRNCGAQVDHPDVIFCFFCSIVEKILIYYFSVCNILQLSKYYSYFIASYPNNLRYNPIWPIQYDSRSMHIVSESKSVYSPPGISKGSGPFS